MSADLSEFRWCLWSALTLRFGTIYHHEAGTEWIYLAVLVTSIPIFVRLGLYRAVIRFLGPKAIFAVG